MHWFILKNTIALVVIFLAKGQFEILGTLLTTPEATNSMFVFVGLMLGSALAANFTFTYSDTDFSDKINVLVSHLITFTAMTLAGIILAAIDTIMIMVLGEVTLFRLTVIMFYTCLLLYDYWDFVRIVKIKVT